MQAHASVEHHMTSVAKMNDFLPRMKHPAETIDSKFDKEQLRFEENYTVIKSLLKVNCAGSRGWPFAITEMTELTSLKRRMTRCIRNSTDDVHIGYSKMLSTVSKPCTLN